MKLKIATHKGIQEVEAKEVKIPFIKAFATKRKMGASNFWSIYEFYTGRVLLSKKGTLKGLKQEVIQTVKKIGEERTKEAIARYEKINERCNHENI